MSLPISTIVDVNVTITPSAPPKIGFGIAAIVSSELPISGIESPLRVTYFNSITEVADIYSSLTEVYKSAQSYFSQSPSPDTLGIIAQYLSLTNAVLTGGTSVDTTITTWQAISNGSFEIGISGVQPQVQNLDFSTVTNMDEVATVIQTALNGADASIGFTGATVQWDSGNTRFIFTSGEQALDITFTVTGLTGVDISPLMQTELAQGGNVLNGRGPETVIMALDAADDFDQNWYGILLVNTVRDIQAAEDVAAWTESRTKVFVTVTKNPNTLLPGNTDNIASRINLSNYQRTMVIYSSSPNEYPDAAAIGKAFVVDFNAPNSVITLKFKSLAGITAEKFNSSQKSGVDEKRANAYITVGGADMFAEGFMSAQLFFDEIHGVDWLVGELESNVFAYLLTRATKVPLTDAGSSAIVQQVTRVFDASLRSGLIASGTTADGEFLANGYKISVDRVADMPIIDKQERKSPVIRFITLLAGATHFVQINGVAER